MSIDGGHSNFHAVNGRYAPFARLLRRDGYVLEGLDVPASSESLAHTDICTKCYLLFDR